MKKLLTVIGLAVIMTACGAGPSFFWTDQPYPKVACFDVSGDYKAFSTNVNRTADGKFQYQMWVPAENLKPRACDKDGN